MGLEYVYFDDIIKFDELFTVKGVEGWELLIKYGQIPLMVGEKAGWVGGLVEGSAM